MRLIFEQSRRSHNPRDTQLRIGRLRGALALDVAYTATRGGARIQTQTLNLQGAGMLTDVTISMSSVKQRRGLWA